MLFQNILDHCEGEKITLLEFFDETDAFCIAVIIFCSVPPPFAGLGKESFADVKMNGLSGHHGMLNQVSDLQESSSHACRGL